MMKVHFYLVVQKEDEKANSFSTRVEKLVNAYSYNVRPVLDFVSHPKISLTSDSNGRQTAAIQFITDGQHLEH